MYIIGTVTVEVSVRAVTQSWGWREKPTGCHWREEAYKLLVAARTLNWLMSTRLQPQLGQNWIYEIQIHHDQISNNACLYALPCGAWAFGTTIKL